jgi:3-oxoadipate enol-lactonase
MTGTVVVCSSLGSTASIWDAQAAVLGRAHVVRIDHPGHGNASLDGVRSVGDLAARVLGSVTDERFSFIGLSLGAAVGMQLALSAPERVDRLVLACTALRFGDPEQWRERAAVVRAEGLDAIVDAVLARWFTPRFPGSGTYREMLLSVDPEGYARCCDALAGWDVRGELGAVRAPTLVIAGADDPSTPPGVVELVAAEIPAARFEVIEGAAHIASVERADVFNRLIEEHL